MAFAFQKTHCSEFVDSVNQQLDQIAALPPNWDREGAPPIDAAIIHAARQFVDRLPDDIAPVPKIVPSSAGNLQFEWHLGSRSLELELETPNLIRYLKWHPEEGVEEEDVFDIENANQAVVLIRWFTKDELNV